MVVGPVMSIRHVVVSGAPRPHHVWPVVICNTYNNGLLSGHVKKAAPGMSLTGIAHRLVESHDDCKARGQQHARPCMAAGELQSLSSHGGEDEATK